MTDSVEFHVQGVPIPQGSKKGFVVGRRAVLVDDNANRLKPWRAKIAAAADFGVTFDCPVSVAATFFMPKPKRSKFLLPGVKPDIDKLCRALLDGMQDGGLLAEDSRVVDLAAMKRYADSDGQVGVEVVVKEAENE